MTTTPALTVKDAAAELCVSAKTVRTWIAKKKLRAVQVGRCCVIRIPRSEWERFLKAGGK